MYNIEEVVIDIQGEIHSLHIIHRHSQRNKFNEATTNNLRLIILLHYENLWTLSRLKTCRYGAAPENFCILCILLLIFNKTPRNFKYFCKTFLITLCVWINIIPGTVKPFSHVYNTYNMQNIIYLFRYRSSLIDVLLYYSKNK